MVGQYITSVTCNERLTITSKVGESASRGSRPSDGSNDILQGPRDKAYQTWFGLVRTNVGLRDRLLQRVERLVLALRQQSPNRLMTTMLAAPMKPWRVSPQVANREHSIFR